MYLPIICIYYQEDNNDIAGVLHKTYNNVSKILITRKNRYCIQYEPASFYIF